MDQQPPPQVPNPYTVVHDSPKPGSIKVFGILNIVFGALGLVCGGFGVLVFFLATQSPEFANEFNRSISSQYAKGYVRLLQISSCFYFILSVIQIACGVGLLKEKNWGRTGSLGYAVLSILSSIASTIGNIMLAKGPTAALTPIFSCIGLVIGVIYPVCILIFLTRPNVVEALRE